MCGTLNCCFPGLGVLFLESSIGQWINAVLQAVTSLFIIGFLLAFSDGLLMVSVGLGALGWCLPNEAFSRYEVRRLRQD